MDDMESVEGVNRQQQNGQYGECRVGGKTTKKQTILRVQRQQKDNKDGNGQYEEYRSDGKTKKNNMESTKAG